MTDRILIPIGDDYEEIELWYPALRLAEAGHEVLLAGSEARKVYRGKYGYPCESTHAISDIAADQLSGVVVPGGWMPDRLRRDPRLLDLVKELAGAQKIVAAICHGGWIPISAGVYQGVRVTGSLGIKDDLTNAGGLWEDAPVVVDGHFISSRKPADVTVFCEAVLRALSSEEVAQPRAARVPV